MREATDLWRDASRAVHLFAADPNGCGGLVLRAGAGPVRDRWLELLRAALPEGVRIRRLPPGIAEDRLLGGLDLASTLHARRPIAQAGLLAEADGGILVVPMAERLPANTIAHLCAAFDSGTVTLAREGLHAVVPARFGLVLLDEGGEDETVAASLRDRLAFHLDLTSLSWRDVQAEGASPASRGRRDPQTSRLDANTDVVPVSSGLEAAFATADARSDGGASLDPTATLCTTAESLGIQSLRAPLLAMKVASTAARLSGRNAIADADTIEAARLVLAPRATRIPRSDQTPPDSAVEPDMPEQREAGDAEREGDGRTREGEDRALDDMVLEAARAAIPPHLLAQLLAAHSPLRTGKAGRLGAASASLRSGRSSGSRAGDPRRGRLDLIATLRAAAPWQALRRRATDPVADRRGATGDARRLVVLSDDLRIRRFVQRSETTAIFCVDASGSAAMERLAEAKGAVELLLAESYVRRDRVALIAFRGRGSELVLSPTRSLVRAKRALAGLPGGGGTPLAAGIDAAAALAFSIERAGGNPVVVLLTDGRANVARSGLGGRAVAGEEALAAGRVLGASRVPLLVIDTGARPDGARRLAETARARYIALPFADATSVSAAVRSAIRR